ncbi:flagellar hook assembly protein FlgD [Aurantimonas sp. VKM B-3413]|uniref:flagellar hook assembly protein FlgD n=1 Tax=Aurantimonas sp. VKM B-3413 TaxID=2779401 RepID=UPI001E391F8D|nr:flagellar hook assembly protein FlgD [Aurantimonas sp. VKM B-3413]MCB8838129.1 flagellar hook assembly protein FlgD [Aurantimonas sp. VKM B-3413]
MSVSGVSPTTGTTSADATKNTAAKSNTVDYDAFLTLLVAQMKNQDPLNPTDSTEFVSQLATFSSVEQAVQTNTKLDSMMTVSALTQANQLIGRTVTSADGSVSGVVTAVRVADGGVQAVLEGGDTVMLQSGTEVE